MSTYVLEIRAVFVRDAGAVGYGVDEHGREFAVALDVGLAADIAKAIDDGQRPIVAVEQPLYPRTSAERAVVVDQVMARRDTRRTGGKPQPSDHR
ncbi:MAG: hypothetical protein ACXWXV_12540 [Aeromicrobium sp.]